jgi:hypothetical protein
VYKINTIKTFKMNKTKYDKLLVPNFFRTFALSTSDLIRVSANSFFVVEDESSGAFVDGALTSRAMQILVASLGLVDAVRAWARSRGLRILEELSSYVNNKYINFV